MLKGYAASIPGEPAMYLSDELQALDNGGTRVISRAGLAEAENVDPELTRMVYEQFSSGYAAGIEQLKVLLRDLATDGSGRAPATTPQSAGRHLSDPITGGMP
jgi:hypothetical protein